SGELSYVQTRCRRAEIGRLWTLRRGARLAEVVLAELLSVRTIDPEQLLHEGGPPLTGRVAQKIIKLGQLHAFPGGFILAGDPIHPLQHRQRLDALMLIRAVGHGLLSPAREWKALPMLSKNRANTRQEKR